ncbi:MAG: class I SAM-dependent methyltransferase [Anaerolineae bacterium]
MTEVGWELIWRSKAIPPRCRPLAAPNDSVVEWVLTIPDGGLVLDVGCGIGQHCVYLGERGFRVAGMDISPTAIKISQEVCSERQIVFDGRVGDMTSLPWADMTFDAALSISTMNHHLRADILRSMNEVRRVLKPGGLFLVDIPSKDRLEYQQRRSQVAAGQLTEPEPDTFVDVRPNLDDMDDDFLPHHYCDEADMRDLLCSFEIVKMWTDLPEFVVTGGSNKRGNWIASVRRPLAD